MVGWVLKLGLLGVAKETLQETLREGHQGRVSKEDLCGDPPWRSSRETSQETLQGDPPRRPRRQTHNLPGDPSRRTGVSLETLQGDACTTLSMEILKGDPPSRVSV